MKETGNVKISCSVLRTLHKIKQKYISLLLDRVAPVQIHDLYDKTAVTKTIELRRTIRSDHENENQSVLNFRYICAGIRRISSCSRVGTQTI